MKKRTTKLPGQVTKAIDRFVSMGEEPYPDLHEYLSLIYERYVSQIRTYRNMTSNTHEHAKWVVEQSNYFVHVGCQIVFIHTLMEVEGVYWNNVKMLANGLVRQDYSDINLVEVALCCATTCKHNPNEFGKYYFNDLLMALKVESPQDVTDYFYPPFSAKLLHAEDL